MEGGSLFNSGFLGASFLWWVGQIADDSVWRDNILPGKYPNKNSIPGWGRRYKVRIIGLGMRQRPKKWSARCKRVVLLEIELK